MSAAAAAPAFDALQASRDKKKRYDRQLRLWGEQGQDALENARICVLYATATGAETAKNLVLPGVGEVTIVDPLDVSRSDLGKNFFVDGDSIGKSRAETVAFLLNELNELVKVHAIKEDPVNLIENKPEFFKAYTQVIVSQDIPTSTLLKLDAICQQNRIALFVVRAYGFMGYLRVATAEHRIYESKPDNFRYDLRVTSPWPELERFAYDFPITPDMESHLYSHIPWLVLLLREAKAWRDTHGGQAPSNRAEQQAFRAHLLTLHRDKDRSEDNIPQAIENAHNAWAPLALSSDLKKIFADPKTEIDSTSRPFWILARAVKDFIANEGKGNPPLPGTLPDMTADTKSFVTLQNLFRDKAAADAASVIARVRALLKSIGRAEDSISEDYIKLACRNTWFWRLLRYRFLSQEYAEPNKTPIQSAFSYLKDSDQACAPLFLALRAADRFRDAHGHLPGSDRSADVLASDTAALKTVLDQLATEFGVTPEDAETDKYSEEFVRWGGAELHNIAAFMGGVAAQEVIKIVTEQLVPVNNTFVFNGMKSASTTYEL